MKWQLNTYILFVSWVDSILIILLHEIIISYPNDKMNRGSSRIEFLIFLISWGIFFEWWELDLQLLPSYSSLLISRAEINHLLLAYILHMNESHDPGRPFKVSITTSSFSTSSSITTSCSLIWETLLKYNCMISAF